MDFNRDIVEMLKKGALEAFNAGEIPVCAVIVDSEMNIVSCRRNERQFSNNLLGHAEILAILDAENVIGDWRLNGYSMYVSLEPCLMCSAVIRESRLDHVYFFVEKSDFDNVIDIDSEYVEGFDEDKVYFRSLLTIFFDNMR